MQTCKFKVKTLQKNYEPKGSCGVYALSYLTGLKLSEIDKFTPKQGWWDDHAVKKFLHRLGYETSEITHDSVHAHKFSGLGYYKNNINHLNVLLISQHTRSEEGSWAVVHKHRYYHGLEIEFFHGYELIVNPFWTGYAVWHPKWKTSQQNLDKAMQYYFVGLTQLKPTKKKVQIESDCYYNPLHSHWTHNNGSRRARAKKSL